MEGCVACGNMEVRSRIQSKIIPSHIRLSIEVPTRCGSLVPEVRIFGPQSAGDHIYQC